MEIRGLTIPFSKNKAKQLHRKKGTFKIDYKCLTESFLTVLLRTVLKMK